LPCETEHQFVLDCPIVRFSCHTESIPAPAGHGDLLRDGRPVKRSRKHPDQSDPDLDGGEEVVRVLEQEQGLASSSVVTFRQVLKPHLTSEKERDFRHRDNAVQDGKQDDDCDSEAMDFMADVLVYAHYKDEAGGRLFDRWQAGLRYCNEIACCANSPTAEHNQ
jgi:hypothetical protein